jgi:ribonuclease D
VNRWADRDPAAAKRLQAARAGIAELSEKHAVPVENLLSPDLLRRLLWSPPVSPDRATVAQVLRDGGAREWQIELTGDLLTQVLTGA